MAEPPTPYGFALIDDVLGWPSFGQYYDIVNVECGYSTDWQLRLEVVSGDTEIGTIIFENPVSFRVQDEGEIFNYWVARDAENVGVGVAYSIAKSDFLDELSRGVSGLSDEPLTHYLVGGMNLCVEVIGRTQPRFISLREDETDQG